MQTIVRFFIVAIALTTTLGLAACGSDDEKLLDRQQIEQATDELSEKIEDAAEEANEAMEHQDDYFTEDRPDED